MKNEGLKILPAEKLVGQLARSAQEVGCYLGKRDGIPRGGDHSDSSAHYGALAEASQAEVDAVSEEILRRLREAGETTDAEA